jgi:hypothetical protein
MTHRCELHCAVWMAGLQCDSPRHARVPNRSGTFHDVIERGKKLIRLVVGSALVIIGIGLSLPGVPGPGFAVVILGLSVLSTDFEFARRLMGRLKGLVRRTLKRDTPAPPTRGGPGPAQ